MTTVTVRPISDGLSFGARVGGVTRDGLDDEGIRAGINEAFEYARCMHRTTIQGDYGLGQFEAQPPAHS